MPAISASSLVAVLQSSLSSNLPTSSTPGRPSTSPGSPDDLQTHPDATWNFPDLRSLSTYAGSSSPHEQEGYATCSWSVAAARGTSAHAVAARLGYPSIDSTVASRGHSAHVPAARVDQDRHRAPAPPRDMVHRVSASQPLIIIVYNGQSDASASATPAFAPTDSSAPSSRTPNDINQRLSFPPDWALHPSSGAHASTLTEAKARRLRQRILHTTRTDNSSPLGPSASSSADPTSTRDAPFAGLHTSWCS